MKKNKKNQQEPCFVILAYCTDCGKLLMESAHMTRKQLLANWDSAVLNAPSILCTDCDPHRCPNFHIELRIKHLGTGKIYNPKDLLPKPTNAPDFSEEGIPEWMLAAMKNQGL